MSQRFICTHDKIIGDHHDRQKNKSHFETLEQTMDTLLQQQRTLNNSGQHHGEGSSKVIPGPNSNHFRFVTLSWIFPVLMVQRSCNESLRQNNSLSITTHQMLTV